MANSLSFLVLTFCFCIIAQIISSPTVDAGGHNRLSWGPLRSGCQGSVADCIGENEFDMDSVINRRRLATNNYISYGSLQRNTVPCSHRGASYYNCKAGAEANPYNRGCSAITRCRTS
ncbi:protein RALF-like 1 [Tripterygium wilfordii]|uniref:protein RALF-like 1 n=1 Tax=Tripterygium wilfordii TaxID=458696 RepID=UPI0018F81672|nr:protein RALF-like 1 [Tripterygium wilfordii]